jgi:hypothetical protein
LACTHQYKGIDEKIEFSAPYFSYLPDILIAILGLMIKYSFNQQDMHFTGFLDHENILFDTKITFLALIVRELW